MSRLHKRNKRFLMSTQTHSACRTFPGEVCILQVGLGHDLHAGLGWLIYMLGWVGSHLDVP